MTAEKVVFVCKDCPFTTESEEKAVKHSGPLHEVWRFTNSKVEKAA